jgi:hypothetical protein
LRKLLYGIMYPREVYVKKIFAFMQIRGFQNLISLQSAVSLQFDCLYLKIRILKQQAFCTSAHAGISGAAQRSDQNYSEEYAHRPSDAMLRRSAGTDFHVEQVLLPPLAHIGHSSIARSGAFLAKIHPGFPRVLARDSAIIRAQRST